MVPSSNPTSRSPSLRGRRRRRSSSSHEEIAKVAIQDDADDIMAMILSEDDEYFFDSINWEYESPIDRHDEAHLYDVSRTEEDSEEEEYSHPSDSEFSESFSSMSSEESYSTSAASSSEYSSDEESFTIEEDDEVSSTEGSSWDSDNDSLEDHSDTVESDAVDSFSSDDGHKLLVSSSSTSEEDLQSRLPLTESKPSQHEVTFQSPRSGTQATDGSSNDSNGFLRSRSSKSQIAGILTYATESRQEHEEEPASGQQNSTFSFPDGSDELLSPIGSLRYHVPAMLPPELTKEASTRIACRSFGGILLLGILWRRRSRARSALLQTEEETKYGDEAVHLLDV